MSVHYITWGNIFDREDAVYFSEAIEHCRAVGLTPQQVSQLLAGAVLRDDNEIDDYDTWETEQEGDWSYEDRLSPPTTDLEQRVEDLESKVARLEKAQALSFQFNLPV